MAVFVCHSMMPLVILVSYFGGIECGMRLPKQESAVVRPDADPFFLQGLLHPFHNKNCSLILRNFWHLDFISSDIPLVSQYFVRKFYQTNIQWVPEAKPYGAQRIKQNVDCSEKYFVNDLKWMQNPFTRNYRNENISQCVCIDNKKWSLAGRQGSCMIFLDYFMPHDALEDKYGAKIYPKAMHSPYSWEPTVPKIHILVSSSDFRETSSETSLTLWLQGNAPYSSWYSESQVHMCLFFIVKYRKDTRKEGKATFVVYILKPPYFLPEVMDWPGWNDIENQTLVNLERTATLGKQLWSLQFEHMKGIDKGVLMSCKDIFSGSKFEDRVTRLRIGLDHIMQMIMGNFSFTLPFGERVCNSNSGDPVYDQSRPRILFSLMTEIYEEGPNMRGNLSRVSSFEFEISLLHLRFVVCGDRDLARPAYTEFFSVFHLNVWVSIVVVIFATCISIASTRAGYTNKPYETTLFELYKVIIEQGDPFPSEMVGSDRFRLIVICFMLGALVISNGYKNANVYEMVQPRVPIRYENLNQLIDDSFVLYSRVAANLYVLKLSEFPYYQSILPHRFAIALDESHCLTFQNEVSFVDEGGDFVNSVEGNNLLKASQFHPRLAELLNQSFDLYGDQLMKTHKYYRKLEENALLKDLRNCNKTAVILPVKDAARFKKTIEQEDNMKRIDVSKEQYSRESLKYRLTGTISRSARTRVRLLQEASILRRWENLFAYDFDQEASLDRKKVVAAPLAGNVQMIFVILLAGCGVAALVFLAEKISQINFQTGPPQYFRSWSKKRTGQPEV